MSASAVDYYVRRYKKENGLPKARLARPNDPGPMGVTPVLVAAAKGIIDGVKALVEKGAKIDTRDESSGISPLMIAALRGHSAVVTYLLERGASTEAVDKEGRTAYVYAVAGGVDALAARLKPTTVAINQELLAKSVVLLRAQRCIELIEAPCK